MASTGLNGQGSFSDYYYSLDKPSRSPYRVKIAKLGGMKDLYLIEGDTADTDSWENWPNVEYPDQKPGFL